MATTEPPAAVNLPATGIRREAGGLPEFAVIGTFKSGTTSLHHYLDQHPDVFLPSLKEPNFFAYDPDNPVHAQRVRTRTMVDTLEEYRGLFRDARVGQRIGEVSPYYLQSPRAAEAIRRHVPGLRMIACLRNPVDRAYSHYLMLRRQGHLSAGPDQAFDPEAFWFSMSFYADGIARYQSMFPGHQLKFILFDDLVSRPAAVVRDIYEFIGVDPEFPADTRYQFNPGGLPRRRWLQRVYMMVKRIPGVVRFAPVSVRRRASQVRDRNLVKAERLPVETRRVWLDLFREDIRRTETLIGRDLSAWLHER